ncbi:MAG: response regulator transcription factor [Firmicutes bacterium]|nr:response regulator transcription factor [Erysipelotrichaceae bacterium]MDD6526084.1 response regulator transcription factor [Bacillota bacterium]MDD7227510.1 response regulator transcription factor [Bacillota bacterium]MDY4972439.1 response regulator transcription factor [Erysipelotrichaceae bacterium]MDY5997599.1 response regulator transcription factor [Erysipelotrichaceae bacterium]
MSDKILVVEDDIDIQKALLIYLKNQGYDVLVASNGLEGLNIINNNEIHLAIVDIMMPIMDGIEMTMKAREKYDFPIIFLSAKSEDIDKITGLNIGADDYITKPFVPLELLARVKSHLRRHKKYLNALNQTIRNSYTVGGLEIDLDTKEVSVDGRIVKVTPIEFKILELLMKSPGRVYSASQIYEIVWQEEAIATDTVMVHIRNLREKIEIDPKNPRYIKVVWGVGYKIDKI